MTSSNSLHLKNPQHPAPIKQEMLLQELSSLTVINLVDNESDGMSSSCSCIRSIPNRSGQKDVRVATYTQEFVSRLNQDRALNMNSLCHAAHGLSLLLIAEYSIPVDDQEDDDNEEQDIVSGKIDGDSRTMTNNNSQDHENYDNHNASDCDSNHGNSDSNRNGNHNSSNSNRNNKKMKMCKKYILLDGGPDPELWMKNATKCKVPLEEISTVVLSHYHTDHSNGLRSAVKEISRHRANAQKSSKVMVDLHESEIVTRGLKVRGKIYPMRPPNPIGKNFVDMGAEISLHRDAHVVEHCFYVSGEIPRRTSFEKGLAGHFRQMMDSKYGVQWVPDEDIQDERYIACKIKGRGIVVFSACSHAGIVNVCLDAMDKLNSKVTAVMGGFHLAGSSVEDRITATVDALKEMDPDLLLAGHCTGWRAKAKLADAFPFNFQSMSVGGMYKFSSL